MSQPTFGEDRPVPRDVVVSGLGPLAAARAHPVAPEAVDPPLTATPGLAALFAMSDATGMMQHAIGVIPDRRHGYCLDDNARALILMNSAGTLQPAEQIRWSAAYAGFIQYAWNPDRQTFRNFMRYDRSWCEEAGSEDSVGRAMWSLGHTAARAPDPSMRHWAKQLFDVALPGFGEVDSPRALAFAMLGAHDVLKVEQNHQGALDLINRGGVLLSHVLDASRRPDWAWFEAVLGYDNPRLPQALMLAGHACGNKAWIDAGMETLGWIADRQTAAEGHFRPVGSETFGRDHDQMPFDQQPLEAQAAVEAATTAYLLSQDARWVDHAKAAYKWYFGANDRGVVLADLASGRCRDGVTPRGVNENCGAESIIAFQLAYVSLIELLQAAKATVKASDRFENQNINPSGSFAYS